jgi:prepilin-type N-terminal cleavage/methylation domain-containing protein
VSNLLKKEKGFTLIEIVLVLAIAGLILVIVFLALSGAQKSRRDTQRKTDAGRIASQLEQYASNNNGTYPTAANLAAFVTAYLTPVANYADPTTGGTYAVTWQTTAPTVGIVSFETKEKCGAGGVMAATANVRDYAVLMYQEAGAPYCRDNQ